MGAMMRRPWSQKGLRRPSLARIGSRVRRPGGGGPEPIDLNMLFDVGFTSGLNDGETLAGFFKDNGVENPPVGTLGDIQPEDWLAEGVGYGSVAVISAFPAGEGASPTSVNVGGDFAHFNDAGWDMAGGQTARLYANGAFISTGTLGSYVGDDVSQQYAELPAFDPENAFMEDGGKYRLRVWDIAPPADEMMLFEIIGTTAEFGEPGNFGFSWINPADAGELTAIGTIVSQSPDDYLPPAGIGQSGGNVYAGDGYVGAGVYIAYDAIPGFSWGYAAADVRLYGDSGHIASTSGVPFEKVGDVLKVTTQFPGISLAEAANYKLRVWIDPARIIPT